MDLIRLTQVESMGAKKYILFTVDDYSRFTWVQFLREKSETFDEFMKLVLKLQKERKTFNSEDCHIAAFCDEHGISHEFSAPKTPQQNGVAERKNRTIQ